MTDNAQCILGVEVARIEWYPKAYGLLLQIIWSMNQNIFASLLLWELLEICYSMSCIVPDLTMAVTQTGSNFYLVIDRLVTAIKFWNK